MSMNIKINAEREVYSKKGKHYGIQEIRFSVWQTPTKVSYEILKSEDPSKAYKEWVMSRTEEEILPVYAEDDFLQQRDPIGTEKYHRGEDHCKELDNFIQYAIEHDYELVYEVW